MKTFGIAFIAVVAVVTIFLGGLRTGIYLTEKFTQPKYIYEHAGNFLIRIDTTSDRTWKYTPVNMGEHWEWKEQPIQ